MASQMHNFSSFAAIISVLSIIFYCAGFLRIELELNEYNKRIHSLASASGNQLQRSKPSYAPTTEIVQDRGLSFRNCSAIIRYHCDMWNFILYAVVFIFSESLKLMKP